MEYKNLGRSGLQVSRLSLGSWLTFGKQVENNIANELMAIAYDHGINFHHTYLLLYHLRNDSDTGQLFT